jgi:hypothetical protein
MMAMMVSLEHRLREGSDEDVEHRFFTHTLQYLATSSGHQVEIEDWMVTSYEVEFGQVIGSGGLYVFSIISYSSVVYLLIVGFFSGQVFKGNWNKTTVALKVLVMEDSITPTAKVRLG